MLGDSSPTQTSSMGASSMGSMGGASPSALGGVQPTGGSPNPMGNQQSFNFNQMGGLMPGSGSRHFGMRRNMLKQTQVGRYNSRPPTGLADTQGIQAMQAKLGLDLSLNSRAKSVLANSKRASKVGALSPALAGQDTSALGLSLGVPPMNPAQPMGQPPPQPQQPGMPPPGAMPPQGMPMPQDSSMQGPAAMGGVPQDPNAQAMAAPGGAPGSMPPAPGTPPMPGDMPPAVQNSGNLVSGLAAQQEGIDENDPAAASDEIAIEAAPGLESGMPKIGSNPGLKNAQFALPEFKGKKLVRDPYIEKLDKLKKQGAITDFAHAFMTRCAEQGVSVKQAALRFIKTFGKDAHEGAVELSDAMLKAGENKGAKFDPKFNPIDDAINDPTHHKVTKLDPNNLDMRRHATPEYLRTGVPSKNAGLLSSAMQVPGQIVRGLKNMNRQTIVPRQLDTVLAHHVPARYAHLPVGASVPGEVPKAPQRAFGSLPTPTAPTRQDHIQGAQGVGALALGTGAAVSADGMKQASDMGSEAKRKGPGNWFTVPKSKKTAGGWWQKGLQAGQQFFGGAGKAVANKANTFLNATPKTYAAAVGTPPRTWSQFGKSMFHGEPTPAGGMLSGGGVGTQIADRGLGAVQGAFTGGSLETPDPESGILTPSWGKGLGAAYGALTGVSGTRGKNPLLNAMHRPMQHAFAGGALGEAADAVNHTFGGDSNYGTMGARMGLGTGLLSNAARANRTWARSNGMNAAPWAQGMGQMDSALQAGAQGTMAPAAWGINKLTGGVNKVLGTNIGKIPGASYTPGAFGNNGLNRAMFGGAAAATAIPALAGVGGAGMGYVDDRIHGAVQNATHQGLDQASQWAQQRGLLGQDGRFDMHGLAGGMGGAMVDRMIQGLGMDPTQMSNADKWMLLGGGAAGGMGMLTGNPMLMAGGLGAAGYGGRNGLMELLGHAARFSTGKNTNQLVNAAMTPGDVRMTGQGWN